MEGWDADLLLQVIQFLNVRDAGRLALLSRRCYYLVHHYRTSTLCGPQLVVGTSRESRRGPPTPSTIREAVLAARYQCQSKPQLALLFERSRRRYKDNHYWTPALLPDNTLVLGAVSEEHQVTLGPENCNCLDDVAAMLLSGLSEEHTTIKPFCSSEDEMDDIPFDDEGRLDWKLFIVYGCGDSGRATEERVKSLQARFPNAVIVGGICQSVYVSVPIDHSLTEDDYYNNFTAAALLEWIRDMGGPMPPKGITKREIARHANAVAHDGRRYRLTSMESGVCGVALAGNVPVRSLVSRGVRSGLDIKAGLDGTPRSQTALYVHEATAYHPGDQDYMIDGGEDPLPTYHRLRRFRDADTGKVYTPRELMVHMDSFPDFVGLRAPDQDGFTLVGLDPDSLMAMGEFLVFNDDVESFVGYNFDVYNLSGDACLRDMDNCMIKLAEQTQNENILGALMFSCNGRGPDPGDLIRESMADATRFANMFPKVPCLGFYAGGEIGPCALAGRQSVFQQGSACLQGFTAVFAVFIVPNVDRARVHLDDGEASIEAFMRRRLLGAADSSRALH